MSYISPPAYGMLGPMPEHSGDQRMVTHDNKGYSNNNNRFMDIDLYLKWLKFTCHILK
jgi:hypothetical protein